MAMNIFDFKAQDVSVKTEKSIFNAGTSNRSGARAQETKKFFEVLQAQVNAEQPVDQSQIMNKLPAVLKDVAEVTEATDVVEEVVRLIEETVQEDSNEVDVLNQLAQLIQSLEQQTIEVDGIAKPILSSDQKVVLDDLKQLFSQLQVMLNNQQTLDLQQLQQLFNKLMQLFKNNAEWMESNTVFRKIPVAEIMLLLNQLQNGQQDDFLKTLHKLLDSLKNPAQLQSNNPSTGIGTSNHEASNLANTQTNTTTNTINTNQIAQQQNQNMVEVQTQTTSTGTAATQTNEQPTSQNIIVNQTAPQTNTVQVTVTQSQTPTMTPQQLPQELQKMMKTFRFNRANGNSEARILLNPEQLGHVNVKISVNNGMVVAQIYTDTAMAKEALEAQMLHLRAALQSSGLTVERLEVFNNTVLSQQFHDQRKQQSNQQFNQQSKQKSNEYVDLNEEIEQASKLKDPLQVGMGSNLDVTA
jgi:flagellar hook-length control protein FliK